MYESPFFSISSWMRAPLRSGQLLSTAMAAMGESWQDVSKASKQHRIELS